MQVSEITSSELPALQDLQPEGWPDILPHFEFYTQSSFCRPLKFVQHGQLVGIGCTIFHAHSAWLAHIIVHKDHRNKGVGQLITQTLIEHVDRMRFPSISLIATDLGAPVYSKLGFQVEQDYHFLKRETLPEPPATSPLVRKLQPEDRAAVLALDKKCSGEDRTILLEPHLAQGKVAQEGKHLGFYLPTLNEGLLISSSPTLAAELLTHHSSFYAVVPDENVAALHLLEQHAYIPFKKASRMSLGPRLSFNGQLLFNRIGGNLG